MGCWVLKHKPKKTGYVQITINGKTHLAHRVYYERYVGPIPEGLTIDHLCRVRHCVNPAHLEPVTMRENTLRGDTITGRNARKTHCDYGHPLSGDNLVPCSNGQRKCRICARRIVRESYYRRKERAKT